MMATTDTPAVAQSPLIWALECVRLPTPGGTELFRPYPYQAALLADRSARQIVLKARQVGVTTVAAIVEAHGAIYEPRSLGLIISRDLVAAQNVIRTILDIFSELDEPPRLTKENQSELVLENGSRIISQPATAKAGRGYTADRVTLDEFAFCEYAERIYRAVSPTLSRGGRLTVISTPNGQANLFYRLWSGMEGGTWSPHRIHWRDCPTFDDAWYERERSKYTSEQWASEFDLDFIASGAAAFDPGDVDAMRDGWNGLQLSEEGRRYVTGWDIGRRRDATVGVTLDVSELPHQVVAYQRLLRAPFAQTQAAIDARADLYGGETFVESNSIGDPVIEGLTCRATPFVTTARSKADMLTRLVRAVEQGEIKCGVEQVLGELKGYQWDDTGLVQDSVIALGIAMHAMQERVTPFIELSTWDRLGGYVPPLGVVDAGADLVAGVDRAAAGDEFCVVIVTRDWRRERWRQDVAVRRVHRLDRQGLEKLLRELKPVHITYTSGVGLEPLMQQLGVAGLWTEPFPSAEMAAAELSLRERIGAGGVSHGGDVLLRASIAAAVLDTTGSTPKMVSRGGDSELSLTKALAMACQQACYLSLKGGPKRE